MPNLPATKTNTEYLIWHDYRGDEPATWRQAYHCEQLPSWMVKHFLLMDQMLTIEMEHPRPSTCKTFFKTIICGFTAYLIHCDYIPHIIASGQETYYNKFEWSNRPTLTAFTVYTMIPNILKQLLSWCFQGGMTFEDLVTAPARWQYLARLRLCSHRSL